MSEALDTSAYASPGTFLSRWYDAGLEIPPDLSEEVVTGDEIGRLTKHLAVVIYAASISRRLGGDASDEEMALDKKRGRRTAHALSQSLRGWAGRVPTLKADDEIRRLGAQMDWIKFREEHAADVLLRLRTISTWAMQTDNEKFGKTAAVKYQNELGWVGYALRD